MQISSKKVVYCIRLRNSLLIFASKFIEKNMEVFKFGGASVKDALAVKNVGSVLKKVGYQNKLVVVSAMGKTTNALEEVVDAYFKNKNELSATIDKIKTDHFAILNDLFSDSNHHVYLKTEKWFDELENFLSQNKSPNYNYVYDQVVSFGELLSTTILSCYLNELGMHNTWLDARNLIKTDATYREGLVDWEATQKQISTIIDPNLFYITQGFIGSDENYFTTTLGREGSDYTAAIFAYCLQAKSVTIWKDVAGVLNADPRYFSETVLLEQISYKEAIEMAFYGASVIHPKTLQPLREREIPLYVKSFLSPDSQGTSVTKGVPLKPHTSTFIVKKKQLLLSIASKNFSFIMEDHIGEIFKLFGQFHIKVNVIQNSAISFSVCIEDKFNNFDKLYRMLSVDFKVQYNENVSLYTIRHFDENSIEKVEKDKTVLLKQINRDTVQIVTKE